jgi:hypothetical protein
MTRLGSSLDTIPGWQAPAAPPAGVPASNPPHPERFAQKALGHNRKAVHRANAKHTLMKLPSLEEYK